MTIEGVAQIARSGLVAIVPANVRHSVRALTDGKAVIVGLPRKARFRVEGVQKDPLPAVRVKNTNITVF